MNSPNGITWTSQTGIPNYRWQSVTYGGGKFVAVASSPTITWLAMTSTNGNTWNQSNTPTGSWQSVTYGNGTFVAVSSSGANRVMTSPDGTTWTTATAAAANSWQSVTYGGSFFVAVSDSGTGNQAMTSPDGITWTIN